MPELSSLNPTGRFTGLAETYARFRPSYPVHGIDFIMTRCGLGRESLLVDVGCGTGIAARLFAARGISVIGIEPNREMRNAPPRRTTCLRTQRSQSPTVKAERNPPGSRPRLPTRSCRRRRFIGSSRVRLFASSIAFSSRMAGRS